MSIAYNFGEGEYLNWVISETEFNPERLGKCEAMMALGNGYMGLRSATEEPYLSEVRNLFVAGTFNKAADNEVTELPNAADVTRMDTRLNGERFDLTRGTILAYRRDLNAKTGELVRNVTWKSGSGETFELCFRRFVSRVNLHLMGMQVSIKAIDCAANISINSGINGQMTNTGAQHFNEGEKRFYDKRFMELLQQTTESEIDFVFCTSHSLSKEGEAMVAEPVMDMDRRKINGIYNASLEQGETLVVEKLVTVHTTRDKEYSGQDAEYTGKYSTEALREEALKQARTNALAELREADEKGFDALLAESSQVWNEFWVQSDITINSKESFDQLSMRLAQFQLTGMTPAHDSRYGVAAKGLSGEGYKGHSFWDTEIFLMPHFTYSNPAIARSLLEYRYHTLGGARRKAIDNGYKGAMYPWESAWKNDGEVTPVWGAVDIITGKATKIWSGFIEQHITCDVAYAIWQYFHVTGDQDFMDRYGYEMLLDTAVFWSSRLEWNEEKQHYGICDVVGPDEYKEHVDNNAFTNYMAHWNIELAMGYYNELKAERPELFAELNTKLGLDAAMIEWQDRVGKIYLPQPREDGVIPQDDTYLQKQDIDLGKYKNQAQVGSMFQDYNLEQVNEIQVSKQADMMVLFYLQENLFPLSVKQANWNYYEPRTLHDSSLSLSTHSVLASDMGDETLAYEMFSRAARIDFGTNLKSSDHGLHMASIGGIWQCVVNGFGGIRMLGGKLRINPKLPAEWTDLNFPIFWKGERLEVTVTHKDVTIINKTNSRVIELEVAGQPHAIDGELKVSF